MALCCFSWLLSSSHGEVMVKLAASSFLRCCESLPMARLGGGSGLRRPDREERLEKLLASSVLLCKDTT